MHAGACRRPATAPPPPRDESLSGRPHPRHAHHAIRRAPGPRLRRPAFGSWPTLACATSAASCSCRRCSGSSAPMSPPTMSPAMRANESAGPPLSFRGSSSHQPPPRAASRDRVRRRPRTPAGCETARQSRPQAAHGRLGWSRRHAPRGRWRRSAAPPSSARSCATRSRRRAPGSRPPRAEVPAHTARSVIARVGSARQPIRARYSARWRSATASDRAGPRGRAARSVGERGALGRRREQALELPGDRSRCRSDERRGPLLGDLGKAADRAQQQRRTERERREQHARLVHLAMGSTTRSARST